MIPISPFVFGSELQINYCPVLGPVVVSALVGIIVPGIWVLELGATVITPVPLAPIKPFSVGAGTVEPVPLEVVWVEL